MTTTTSVPTSLFARLGGDPALTAVMGRFFERILDDPALSPMFARVNIERHQRKTVAFVGAATGGPEPWHGRDMASAHRHLNLTDAQFDQVAGHLVDTLAEFEVPDAVANELLTIVGSLRSDIVTSPGTGSPATPAQ